ncbi:hypothetical protein [Burkholderia phage FLC9]|nr:hypothetical protein [Burkholderia phage FLC9]
MNAIQTLIRKFPFVQEHPSHPDNRLVRVLAVSDTLYVPEGYTIPSNKELGWLDPNGNNVVEIIRAELIRSKIDGLSPAAVSEVIRTVNESKIGLLIPSVERVRSNWVSRYAIKVTMPGREHETLWFEPNADNPLRAHARSEWSGIGDPDFFNSCVWVSDVVAAGKAKEILDRWQAMGFAAKPIATEVREICYGRQQVQLSTEFQRDALHGSVCAFTPYRGAEMV